MDVLQEFMCGDIIVIVNDYLTVFDYIRFGWHDLIKSRLPKKMRFKHPQNPSMKEIDALGALIYSNRHVKGFDRKNYIHFPDELRQLILTWSVDNVNVCETFMRMEYETFGIILLRCFLSGQDEIKRHTIQDYVITFAISHYHDDLIKCITVVDHDAARYVPLAIEKRNRDLALKLLEAAGIITPQLTSLTARNNVITAIKAGCELLAMELMLIAESVNYTSYVGYLSIMIQCKMTTLIPHILDAVMKTQVFAVNNCPLTAAICYMPELIPRLVELRLYSSDAALAESVCRHRLQLDYAIKVLTLYKRDFKAYTAILGTATYHKHAELAAYLQKELATLQP